MDKRKLTAEERKRLEEQGCTAADWDQVTVAADFVASRVFRQVHFFGEVELGVYRGRAKSISGFDVPAGVSFSVLHNVRIGNDCLIHMSRVANADIGDNVVMDNVGGVYRQGDQPFANECRANILAEDGARSVPLWRGLSSQLAHILCHFKNHPAAKALEEMIARDADTLRLPRTVISSSSRVRRVMALKNVYLGEGCSIMGASRLENCYIGSTRTAPTRIGPGVEAVDSVFLASSEVTGGVQLSHCLVGEGVRLDGGFSGKHSLFFANSTCSMGESSCALAGPFSMSTHKSTLVLTCQCSFNTFGSGANSSNHHFKLGPLHGGVLRRGARNGSGSYIFWPSDIGAFTTVVGRHTSHLDTADFPFSLLVAKGDMSTLVPGVNLFTSGAFRDVQKWLARDRRRGVANPRDLVNTAMLSPYVLQDMDAGVELLRRSAIMGVDLRHGGAVIPASRLEPALRLYEAALEFHLGDRLLAQAGKAATDGKLVVDDLVRTIRETIDGNPDPLKEKWRDWGGMLLPGGEANRLIADLESGALTMPAQVERRLAEIHADYDRHEWIWLAWRWRKEFGEPTPESVSAFLDKWRKTVLFRHECFVKDANKEFSPEMTLGFGLEEDASVAFRRVRGTLSGHPLLAQAEAERERLLGLAKDL